MNFSNNEIGVGHVLRAERLLKEMRSRDGGSLRLLAFQVKDAMSELIKYLDYGTDYCRIPACGCSGDPHP